VNKPILVATRHFLPAVEERIARDFCAFFNDLGRPFTRAELRAAAQGADALLVSPADKLDAHFFESLPESVKVIASFSVGYDHIDLGAAAKRGVAVANTPDVLTDATADIAMLLLLSASRRASEGQILVRSERWKNEKSKDLLGWDLGGKTLGILGLGRIGRAVAHRARAFGLKIHYSNRQQLPPEIEDGAVFHSNADELLSVSNLLSLHVPSTPETRNFLCRRRIELLPAGAIVVNTARGNLINDADLINALKTGRIAAAGLDVFDGEPNVNPGYLDLPNVFLLPHMGSATVETRTAMGMLALDNIDAVLKNVPAPTLLRA
jgi:lactate dehydrogenase-like 2-hydroxyacid dehydrogenase